MGSIPASPPPAGTIVHLAFRVVGYSNDGLAILEYIDQNGKSLGHVINRFTLEPGTYTTTDKGNIDAQSV